MTPNHKKPEYHLWSLMKQRCTNPNTDKYDRYGGRGIKVCDRWMNSFENFYADMGPRPSTEHTIERENNNGNYEPNNCRWATKTEQANNRSSNTFIELNGQKVTIADASRELGVKYNTLLARVKRGVELTGREEKKYTHNDITMGIHGWARRTGIAVRALKERIASGMSFEDAVTKVPRNAMRVHNGVAKPIGEWARHYGISRSTLNYRLANGWEFSDALTTPVV